MIKSYFGIEKTPFSNEHVELLKHQQSIFDILKVHSQQGGFCLLMGQPGTGKSTIRDAIISQSDKLTEIISISRTLHTYRNTIKILCQAYKIEDSGDSFKCEKRLIEEAYLIIIIDEAHLMTSDTLRKLRLLLEDFPKNYMPGKWHCHFLWILTKA